MINNYLYNGYISTASVVPVIKYSDSTAYVHENCMLLKYIILLLKYFENIARNIIFHKFWFCFEIFFFYKYGYEGIDIFS